MVNEDRTYSGFSYFTDGPLQFIWQDTGKPEFADMFYNVAGVSKSFDPMLPTSNKGKRGGTQIGAELLKLKYGQRTPVFLKENSKHRKFGCWYLRIRPKNKVSGPLEGIIKISTILNEISAGGADMENEDKKDFKAMLHDSKDMPKFRTITDRKSIEKYGGSRMYFAPLIDYDRAMKQIPCGKVIAVWKIWEYFARLSGADFTEPITAGI